MRSDSLDRLTTTGRVSDRWIVETTTGPVKGHAANGAVAFRGIPYAEQPVGDLRFRRAVAKEPWHGVLLADRPGDYCAQWRNPKTGWIGSENCLWLNVVVPRDAAGAGGAGGRVIDPDAGRPVVVYLHGGGNVHGSAGEPLLSGEYFAGATDCVYVAVNYRVGILGQLALGNADDLDPDRFDGNTGLSDIMTAIEWVHANARAFGGDPDRITVMGESSGGAMVTALSAAPRIHGLVAGFIGQSPAAAMVHTPELAGRLADRALKILRDDDDGGRPRPEETGTDLLTASPQGLAWLTERLNAASWGNAGIAGGFAPVIDDLLPRHPLEPGAQFDVPLLLGTNLDEYVLMRWSYPRRSRFEHEAQDFAALIDPTHGPGVLADVYNNGHGRGDAGRFLGDALFTAPTQRMAAQHPSRRAWLYRLDMSTPSLNISGIGATHALDLPILFGRYDSGRGPGALLLGGRDRMRATTAVMQPRWRRFIHDGDPGWEAYADGYVTQIFDGGEESVADPDPAVRQAWAPVSLTGMPA
jgi:para-nitrobenzyl esterase